MKIGKGNWILCYRIESKAKLWQTNGLKWSFDSSNLEFKMGFNFRFSFYNQCSFWKLSNSVADLITFPRAALLSSTCQLDSLYQKAQRSWGNKGAQGENLSNKNREMLSSPPYSTLLILLTLKYLITAQHLLSLHIGKLQCLAKKDNFMLFW